LQRDEVPEEREGEIGEKVLAAIGGVHCIGEIIDVHGEPGQPSYDVQWWGRYSRAGRFNPSWLDEDDDEIFLSENARRRKANAGGRSFCQLGGWTDEC
jgi:hypothetical protein